MRLVEIIALENGAHRNMTTSGKTVPEGWAIIPDDMECENFPFGNLTVDEQFHGTLITLLVDIKANK